MTDERLKEIEALATAALTTTTGPNPMSRDSLRRGNRDDARIILELLAEVRRLRELSRCARDLAGWVNYESGTMVIDERVKGAASEILRRTGDLAGSRRP